MSETILTKICTQCNINKPFSEYHTSKILSDGLFCACKVCICEKASARRKTRDGLITGIYSHQMEHSRSRGDVQPDYTLKELRVWVYSQPHFEKLYNNWVDSGYNRKVTPSCDRVNDYHPYRLDNLQLITFLENEIKGYADRVNGVNNKISKAVNQYSLDGELIKTHYSQMSACRTTGISNGNICACCAGTRVTAGGFRWEYSEE